jgi:hypothetical protein
MQFRIRTLLVMVTLLAGALTLSSQSEPVRRVALLLAIAGVWFGSGLVTLSLRNIQIPIRWTRLIGVLTSLLVTAAALGSTVLVTAMVLTDLFHRTPGTP